MSRLSDALAGGKFTVTAELGPPVEPDAELVREAARALAPCVDAANVTDNQAATVKMSPVVCSLYMQEQGLEPILQLTGRDRNLMALQSELLGAWALGVRSVLALSGDPLKVGKYEELASAVKDVDSTGMTKLIAGMNAGKLAAGEELKTPTGFLIAGAGNPLVDSVERLEGKVAAGVDFFQTNIVYDAARFEEWFKPIVASGLAEKAPFLIGVTPARSTKMLQFMHDVIPGVEVDDKTFSRMEGLKGDEAKTAGIELATELIGKLRDIEGVAGVHLMAPGWETEAVPRLVEGASIGQA
jgi:methylenetetrahydrofolate reductase (NADPH)